MTYSAIVATLPLLALASALPASEAVQALHALRQTFSINQVSAGTIFKSGPMAMEKTFLKFTNTVPSNIAVAAAAASSTAAALQTGSVVATPEQYDESYLCPVQIGSPAQTLALDFDTGSADLWVFSNKQPASQTTGHAVYNTGSDTSAEILAGYSWNISYGDGSGAAGNYVVADKVVVGGVTATAQAVEAATSIASSFTQDTPNDGLLGLAFSSINTVMPVQQKTFFDSVLPSLPSPIFTATLKKGKPGTYDFGFIDSTKYTGAITYTPVNSVNGFWEFTASGYSIGSTFHASTLDAIADTGTTLIYIPATAVRNYYKQVSGAQNNYNAGGYIFPCSSTLPDFSVTIGGISHTVPGSYINFTPYQNGDCFGGIQSSAGIGINILGDVFLKSQYVVFDHGSTGSPRIGFAQQSSS